MRRELPILFSTDMVRALLAGLKTQTRRIIKEAVGWDHNWSVVPIKEEHMDGIQRYEMRCGDQYSTKAFKCPYGEVGDILWVRETFLNGFQMTDDDFDTDDNYEYIPKTWYKSSTPDLRWFDGESDSMREGAPWKPSIHMPKAAARIWLEITGLRPERLRDITSEDAVAEGILFFDSEVLGRCYKDYLIDPSGYGHPEFDFPITSSAIASYATLWAKINGMESWQANPSVWVPSFKVLSTTGRPVNLNENEN